MNSEDGNVAAGKLKQNGRERLNGRPSGWSAVGAWFTSAQGRPAGSASSMPRNVLYIQHPPGTVVGLIAEGAGLDLAVEAPRT